MPRISTYRIFFLVALVLFPLMVFATQHGGGIVPCGNDLNGDGKVGPEEACRFEHFIIGLNTLINTLILIAASLAAISFAYAGWLYMTAQGNTSQIESAHKIFGKVLTGFVIALSAWLIVKALLVGLGVGIGFSLLG